MPSLLHVTESGFLEARSLIVVITYLSVDLLISVFYIFITFCIRETPKRVSLLIQTVKAKMKCRLHFIKLYTACKDKTIVGKKNTLCFSFSLCENYNLTP